MTYNRIEAVKKMLKKNKTVTYAQLSNALPDVSVMTLRRDIERLEVEGFAKRIRGGATLIGTLPKSEDTFSKRLRENADEKDLLVKSAVSLIESGRSVFLDSGTTMLALAKILPNKPLSVVTSGPNVALELANRPNTTLNLIGGTLNPNNCSVAGASAIMCLKMLNIDLAFISPSGFSLSGGFTVGNYADCEVKKAVIKKASKVIMLLSKHKLDKTLPFTFANLKDVDVLITDLSKDNTIVKKAEMLGVSVITV